MRRGDLLSVVSGAADRTVVVYQLVYHDDGDGRRIVVNVGADHTDVVREWDMDALKEAVERGGPPTPDEVSITWDGRRLDSREAVLAFLEEINRERAERESGATA